MTRPPVLSMVTRSSHPYNPLSEENRYRVLNVFLNGLTLTGILIILFPLYWMWNSALVPIEDVYDVPAAVFPFNLTFEHFNTLLTATNFPSYYTSSIVLALGSISLVVTVSTLGGYGLTRISFPYKRTFARGILFGYMFPPILLGIPMYILWSQVGLINSYVGVILAVSATGLPFTLWIMWQFFQTVPYTLEESARMAGSTRFRAFIEIALPLSKPGVVAIATWSYAHAWNAYTIPKILLVDENLWTLTLGIDNFVTAQEVLWPQIMGAAAMTLIPSFLFLYTLRKYLFESFKRGAI